jgi:hypothetical protein
MPTTTDSTETPALASASRNAARIESDTAFWFGDPPLEPALRRYGGASQKAQAAVLESADHQPYFAAARVESRCVNRFRCHKAVNPWP